MPSQPKMIHLPNFPGLHENDENTLRRGFSPFQLVVRRDGERCYGVRHQESSGNFSLSSDLPEQILTPSFSCMIVSTFSFGPEMIFKVCTTEDLLGTFRWRRSISLDHP